MAQLPRARRSGLIIEELPDEVLVYDSDRDRALCLNHTAARVWRLCDGRTTRALMGRLIEKEFQVTGGHEVVSLALEQLEKFRLLTGKLEPQLARVSRRDLVRRIGIAVALVPVITLILVPTARAQATCFASGSPCARDGDCCSNSCVDNGRGGFECT
ncbi:MAG: PqqD family peptide modification chaperone [Pyrinomonadaceae bacterium]